MQPNQATLILETIYMPALLNEHRISASIYEAIPQDKADFRPDEVSKSAMDLAWHTVSADIGFLKAVIAGEFGTGLKRPDTVTTPAELVTWYKQNFEENIDKLSKLSDDHLAKVLDFRGMFQMPAVMFLGFLLHHSIHHRGQLSMYLRPMGAKVPSIYGESYDATEARKASQQNA